VVYQDDLLFIVMSYPLQINISEIFKNGNGI
jgi:hypothetical protein